MKSLERRRFLWCPRRRGCPPPAAIAPIHHVAALRTEAMHRTGVRDHIERLPCAAQFWDEHLSVKAVDGLDITLNDQNRAADWVDLGARKFLILRCVIAPWILEDERCIGWCEIFFLREPSRVKDSGKRHA